MNLKYLIIIIIVPYSETIKYTIGVEEKEAGMGW